MTSDALTLAALATAALPGLRPIRAEAVRGRVGERYQVGFVEDAEHRRWVVRVPSDAVAAAQQDASVTLLGMLARRLPFSLPSPKGFAALKDGRRAMVYPLITGHALSFYALPPGHGLAVELGRALAALHNVDRRLFEEAAVPTYDAEECRRRHLVLLDRGAATGAVPVGLLSRWERLLDDVSWWRFAPTPVHGRLDGPHVLASFSSPDDASSGRIRAIVGWEDARVGDPAGDLAALVAQASPETVDTVLEAYAMSRIEHPDPHLERRARLVAELRLVEDLLAATAARDRQNIAAAAHALRRLDSEVGDPDRLSTPPGDTAGHTAGGRDDDQLYRAGAPDPEATSRWMHLATEPDAHEGGAVLDEPEADGAGTALYAAGAAQPPTSFGWIATPTHGDDEAAAGPRRDGSEGARVKDTTDTAALSGDPDTRDPGVALDPDATRDPGATRDPDATRDPGAALDPNATAQRGQTPNQARAIRPVVRRRAQQNPSLRSIAAKAERLPLIGLDPEFAMARGLAHDGMTRVDLDVLKCRALPSWWRCSAVRRACATAHCLPILQ